MMSSLSTANSYGMHPPNVGSSNNHEISQSKRIRAGSISGRLRAVSDLEETGYIDKTQKGIIKDLIICGDIALQLALDKFEKGDTSDLESLIRQGLFKRRQSIDLLEGLDFDFLNVNYRGVIHEADVDLDEDVMNSFADEWYLHSDGGSIPKLTGDNSKPFELTSGLNPTLTIEAISTFLNEDNRSANSNLNHTQQLQQLHEEARPIRRYSIDSNCSNNSFKVFDEVFGPGGELSNLAAENPASGLDAHQTVLHLQQQHPLLSLISTSHQDHTNTSTKSDHDSSGHMPYGIAAYKSSNSNPNHIHTVSSNSNSNINSVSNTGADSSYLIKEEGVVLASVHQTSYGTLCKHETQNPQLQQQHQPLSHASSAQGIFMSNSSNNNNNNSSSSSEYSHLSSVHSHNHANNKVQYIHNNSNSNSNSNNNSMHSYGANPYAAASSNASNMMSGGRPYDSYHPTSASSASSTSLLSSSANLLGMNEVDMSAYEAVARALQDPSAYDVSQYPSNCLSMSDDNNMNMHRGMPGMMDMKMSTGRNMLSNYMSYENMSPGVVAVGGGYQSLGNNGGIDGMQYITDPNNLTHSSLAVPKLGAYTPEERQKRITKFLEKRSKRIWTKKVKYDVRKNFADSRLRVKGRFVKKEEESTIRDKLDS